MKKIDSIDWNAAHEFLNERGYCIVRNVLTNDECLKISSLYEQETLYRSVINMKRYRFGEGEYKYFGYPIPSPVQFLRENFYPPLSHIANEWMNKLDIKIKYPSSHPELLNRCKEKNQNRPTPLILRYEPGGFNTLHQDLYGDVYFPFQLLFVLTQHGEDHTGGELVLTEQVPRAQSRATVLTPNAGDLVIFTTNFRPVKGSRGYYRATMKHGVSEVRSGIRYSLGIIFHDAA